MYILNIILWIIASFLFILILFFMFWKFYFLRDPERKIPEGDNLVSPADGKVMYISTFDTTNKLKDKKNNQNHKNHKITINKSFIGKINTLTSDTCKKGYIVSIFMSPMDVHVNRSPMKGKIIYQKHFNGKFLIASTLDSIIENEKNELIIQNNETKVKVIQVAGFVARKIESFVKVNQNLDKGQRFGLINLGSQVNIIFPDRFKPIVKIGQKVKAGSSIIAVKK
jgi:phosphatidylserine decarboxylase